MNSKSAPKYLRTGALATAMVQLQRTTAGSALINSAVENAKLHDRQTRRAHAAYLGLVVLMILLWSTILISAVFTLRVNKEACEKCPLHCQCRGSPPAWG